MAATKPETSLALAALTSAALSLPGLKAYADTPVAQAEGNTAFGYYQESNNRMQVEMSHVGGVVPLNDRIEASFSLDRDTYSGASPAYSLPETMTNQPATPTSVNGKPYADVVSSASQVSAQALAGGQSLNPQSLPNSTDSQQASPAESPANSMRYLRLLGFPDASQLPPNSRQHH